MPDSQQALTKKRFPAQGQRQLQTSRVRARAEAPRTQWWQGEVHGWTWWFRGLLQFNDSMIPQHWVTIKWLFWSGTIWRRRYWRTWRNREIYRGQEMATNKWKRKLHGGSSSCICLARRKGGCRGSWRNNVTPEGDGEVVACSCCTETARRA